MFDQITQNVSNALFQFDPAETCCKENDCFDEYDFIAERVVQDPNSLNNVLSESFGYKIECSSQLKDIITGLVDEIQ